VPGFFILGGPFVARLWLNLDPIVNRLFENFIC